MALVTVDQRKAFAKAGVSMPDGSYYIRNASDLHNAILSVGRGDASHDVIRKHCIARAKALHLENMIPSNWNPDGSLKHADTRTDAGKRTQLAELLVHQAVAHEKQAADHAQTATHYAEQRAELMSSGVDSPVFKRVYGIPAVVHGNFSFYAKAGKTKPQALQETASRLTWLRDQSVKQAEHHMYRAQTLRARAAKTLGLTPPPSLAHFGVKGMHWGVRNSRSSGSSHPVSADAARAHATMATIKRHGTGAVSSQDLQHLVSRLQLEGQHGKLNQRQVSTGEKIAREIIINTGKQTAQAFAAKYAMQGTEKLLKLAAKKAVGG